MSRSLNCVYLEAVRMGEVVDVEAEVMKVGKKLGEKEFDIFLCVFKEKGLGDWEF